MTFERRVSVVQCLFRQHVPYLLANVVCGQLVQLERRMVFGKPTLQIAVVVLVIVQCPGFQALCLFGSKEEAEVIIEWMMQGGYRGSQSFTYCLLPSAYKSPSQNECKKAAIALAAVVGMFIPIIKLRNLSGQDI